MLATGVFRGNFQAMRGKNTRKLFNYVPEEITRALHQGLGQIYDLYPVWPDIVGPDLAKHSRPLVLAGKSLVVQVESPVWAASMRQRHQAILTRFKEVVGMQQVDEIRVRVSPTPLPVGPTEASRAPAQPVTKAAADSIALTAAAIEDPSLKEALMRLYSSTSKSSKEKA